MSSTKTLTLLATAVLASGLFMSCRPKPVVTPDPVALALSAQVMSLDYEGSGFWGEKAEIGVFVTESGTKEIIGDNANVRYSADFSTGIINLTPADNPIILPEDGTHIDLAGYYPYSPELTTASGSGYLLHADLSDQTYLDPDMILLAKVQNRSSVLHTAMLTLKPAYAKIKVALRTVTDVKSEDSKIDVSIEGISCEADIDVLEGRYVSYGPLGSTTMTRPLETAHMYEGIVLPQAVADEAVLKVHIPAGAHTEEESISLVLKDIITELKANNQYDITVTVSPTGIEATLVGVSDFFVSDWKEDFDEINGEIE